MELNRREKEIDLLTLHTIEKHYNANSIQRKGTYIKFANGTFIKYGMDRLSNKTYVTPMLLDIGRKRTEAGDG